VSEYCFVSERGVVRDVRILQAGAQPLPTVAGRCAVRTAGDHNRALHVGLLLSVMFFHFPSSCILYISSNYPESVVLCVCACVVCYYRVAFRRRRFSLWRRKLYDKRNMEIQQHWNISVNAEKQSNVVYSQPSEWCVVGSAQKLQYIIICWWYTTLGLQLPYLRGFWHCHVNTCEEKLFTRARARVYVCV
jgi:hypothetical protein